jgi:PAS domain S-box-containing protein
MKNNSKSGVESRLKEERQVLLMINDAEVCKKVENSIYEKFGFEAETAPVGKKALEMIEESPWQYDVAVIYDDLKEKSSSLEVLKEIKNNYPEMEVIYIINSKEKTQNDALHEGAFGCFFIPINYEAIVYGVKFAREKAQFRRERRMLEKLQELTAAINSAIELQDIQNLTCKAAKELLNADHSALVEFEKDISKGKIIAEYPGDNFIGVVVQVKGIQAEEQLVYNKEIINVPDLSRYDGLGEDQKILMDLKIRSLLIVPVVLNDKVIASISLDMIRKSRRFHKDEIELCKKLANQVAIAIGKARYLKELSVLNKIGHFISSAAPIDLDVNKILGRVREYAGELLDVTNFYISLYDEEKEEYSFPYFVDKIEQKYDPKEMKRGLTDYVRRKKKPVLVNKSLNDKLIKEGEIELIGTQALIWLGAPLIVRNRVLGVMVVQSYENEKAYDEHDLKTLETIASQTAIAIDNAKLFEDAKRRIRDLEIVNNIVHIISTKLDTKDLLKEMVTQIAEKLKCSHCTIFLPKKIKGELLLVPQRTHGLDSKRIMTRIFKPGEGLAGWVFQHGESIVTPDARNDNRYVQSRQRRSLPHSMLVAPLKVGNRTIGVISADQDKEHWFNESDLQLVNTLTKHAGIAIERALGLNLLQEIGLQLISSEDENKILQRVVTGAIELTNTSSGTIYLISDDGKSVIKSYPYPHNLDHPPPRMHKKDGYTRMVIDTGEMFIVPDLSEDDRINPELLKHMRSMIAVPLKIGNRVVGVLFLHDKESRSFTETECSLLDILASQAAIAIYNAHLYKESQKRLTEINYLYETSQEIVEETMNIKSVLDKILTMAVKLSNADSALVFFRDTATDELKVVFTQKLEILRGVKLKPGEGMASEVVRTGKPIFSNDYYNSQYKAEIFNHPKYQNLFKSLAEVPLKWKGEVIGILAISSNNPFTEESIRLLERFAGPAAIAISIAREISFRQTLLNNSPNAIIAIDKKGTIKEFNKASMDVLGYTKEEILNKSVVDIWGGLEEARRIKSLLYKENGTVHNIDAYLYSKTGKKIPVLFSGSLLYAEAYGEDKEEIGSIGHIEDQRIISLRGRTRKLFETIEEINRIEELPKLLNTILHRTIELLEADSGYIVLVKDGEFEVVERFNFKQSITEIINTKIDRPAFTPIIEEGIPKTFSNISSSLSGILISEKGKSGLVIPLNIEDDIIGSIYLESHKDDFFREENELLPILSAEAAVAINRAQLEEESERLQLLKKIGDEIRKGYFSEYIDIIVETTRKILHSEVSAIFLFQKSNRSLIRKAWNPKFDQLEKIDEIYPEMKGITGKILACKENDHIIYNDKEDILNYEVSDHLEKYKCLPSWKKKKNKFSKSPIQHYLAVPIVGEKGKVYGAFRVMNKISREYSEENPELDINGFQEPEDVELLKTIASLLSQGLSSERKAEKLKILREITKEISEKTDIKGIGDCVVQSIVKLLGYSACTMRLVRGDKLELISHAGFYIDRITDMTINTTDGFLGSVVRERESKIAYDIFSDDIEKNSGYLYIDFAREENLRSACCVPIKGLKGEVVGIIVVYMRQVPYEFSDYEVDDNFAAISATCAIALRKVQAVDHLQKLVELLGLVHLANSKYEILDACINEMLAIFDAHSAIIYETSKSPDVNRKLVENLVFEEIYTKNIDCRFDVPNSLLLKTKKGGPQTFNASEFPKEWDAIKKQYSQCLAFTLEFQEETLGLVMLFTEVGIPFILHEIDRYNLASAISRQLAIAFKNIEITDEIERMRVSQPAIISTQYVSGMIHELASSAHKGKAAVTYISGSDEYRQIYNRQWRIEMSKIESAFDEIGAFATRALEIKDMARMKFIRNLEYRSINDAIRDVLHDCNYEARKKLAKINWNFDKEHNKKHAYFDQILIKQAIRNLISNSLKWIPDHGDGKISITSGEKEGYIYIRIEDNGWGIDSKIEKSIFEPFFTTSKAGYGIGLFFVKNVVKMHEGEVKLVSVKNPTIFEIKISSKLKKGGY